MAPGSWCVCFPYGVVEQSTKHLLQWLVVVLYGITATLFAYCVSLFMSSPLASFAVVAGYQVVMFLVCVSCKKATNPRSPNRVQVYLIGYLVTYTYAQSSQADKIVDTIRKLVGPEYIACPNRFIRLGGFRHLSCR